MPSLSTNGSVIAELLATGEGNKNIKQRIVENVKIYERTNNIIMVYQSAHC